MAFNSTQAGPATASKVERNAILAGTTSPTSNVGNTDNADAIAAEFSQTLDATAARIAYVGRTKATGVTVSPTTATKTTGQTQQLTPTMVPGGATVATVQYTTDNAARATVNASGLVTVVAPTAPATVTLTSDATNVTDGDTVTLASTVYRFKNTMAQAYDVKIGADAATTLANLKKAINASGTPGTEYYTGTLVHPTVKAGAITATTLVISANTSGTAGNSIASTETSTHLAFGAATLLGGTVSNATVTVTTDDGHFSATSVITITA